jgi:hypothetical protein
VPSDWTDEVPLSVGAVVVVCVVGEVGSATVSAGVTPVVSGTMRSSSRSTDRRKPAGRDGRVEERHRLMTKPPKQGATGPGIAAGYSGPAPGGEGK